MRPEQRIIHSILGKWGAFEERQLNQSAYAATTPLYRFMTEGSPGKPVFSASILHAGTPADIFLIRQGVEKLADHPRSIVWVKYVFHVKPDGGLWSDQEKAYRMGITYAGYTKGLQRAREALMQWI